LESFESAGLFPFLDDSFAFLSSFLTSVLVPFVEKGFLVSSLISAD
jgi:hypothetical protein